MTTALVYDPILLEHLTPDAHPERPERLRRVIEVLEALNWMEREGLVHLAPRAASVEELALIHDPAYIRRVEHAAERTARLEPESGRKTRFFATDTYVSARSYEAALYAAGAPLTAIDALIAGKINNAYCLVRPPGHHALADSA